MIIVLDETDFAERRHRRSDDVDGAGRTIRECFLEHGTRFVESNRNEQITSFRLRLPLPADTHAAVVNNWVVTAASGGALEELSLDFSDGDNEAAVALPPELYDLCRGTTLRTLTLSGCRFDASRLGRFAGLRAVTIARAAVSSGSITALVTGLGDHLEELNLMRLSSVDFMDICPRGRGYGRDEAELALRRLVVEGCTDLEDGVRLVAARLVYFRYSGEMTGFTFEECGRMDVVVMDFGEEVLFSEQYGDALQGALSHIMSATDLTVDSYVTQVVASGEEPNRLPAMSDTMRHLTLKEAAIGRREWPGIAMLLRSFPMLETLTIHIGNPRQLQGYQAPFKYGHVAETFWDIRATAMRCVRRTLRNVRVEGFRATVGETALLVFLLKEAKVLEEMSIVTAAGHAPTAWDHEIASQLYGFAEATGRCVKIVLN